MKNVMVSILSTIGWALGFLAAFASIIYGCVFSYVLVLADFSTFAAGYVVFLSFLPLIFVLIVLKIIKQVE